MCNVDCDKDIGGGAKWESVPTKDCMLSAILASFQQLIEEHQVENPRAAALQKHAVSRACGDLLCKEGNNIANN